MPALTTLLGYFALLQFFFLDQSRRGADARSFAAGRFDQNSTLYIGIAFFASVLALLISWFLDWRKIGRFPLWVGWIGVLLACFGVFFRWWANRVLGAFYTRTLKVTKNQTIIRHGPYRLIRHPGYLGSISIWTGAAAATSNWIVFLVVLFVILGAYVYRMENEEKMLADMYTDYSTYKSQSWRLIPWVY